MREELVNVTDKNLNDLKESQIVKILFSSSYEKFKNNERIINEASDLSSLEKMEAYNKNYDRFRKEIVENAFGVIILSVLLSATFDKEKMLSFFKSIPYKRALK